MQILGMIFGLAMISYFFIGDNLAYNFVERGFIGITIAFSTISTLQSLKSTGFDFILAGQVWLLIPIGLGLLVFSRLTRFRWAARYPVAFSSGIGLGLIFGLIIRSQILAVLIQSIQVLFVPDVPVLGAFGQYSTILIFVGTAAVLSYFLYAKAYSNVFHSRKGKLYYFMRFGRAVLMISFGYSVGGVITNRWSFLNNALTQLFLDTYTMITQYMAGI